VQRVNIVDITRFLFEDPRRARLQLQRWLLPNNLTVRSLWTSLGYAVRFPRRYPQPERLRDGHRALFWAGLLGCWAGLGKTRRW
jgi:hypothetical protein